jgi:hypothetical protein
VFTSFDLKIFINFDNKKEEEEEELILKQSFWFDQNKVGLY